MSARTLAAFSTIRTEGAMLPSDILVRVASGDKSLGGLEESSYHLAPGEKIGEATNRAWNRLQAAWANFQSAREKLAATDTGTSLSRERWLLPLFQLLDYGRLQAAKAEEIGGKSYAISHAWQQTLIHLVGCNVDLDRRIQTSAGGLRSSPHSLLQELLNRSDQHLWGIVSNGLRLRLLRDNISLTRQAYVEFDLEAMMAGEAYPDFVLLWLLLHQSRFEAERPDQCQLEKWSQAARTEGVRVLDGLRDGVQRAIENLGQGFLSHPSNAALRENLRSGALDKQDYYRQILRLVYRLLFLFVADDRDLLLTATADPAAQKRYRSFYATTRLRHLATTRAGSRHHDLYCALKVVMERLSGDGCPELALPALGSFLFSPRALPDLNACDISNLHLLDAIRSLAVTQTGQSRRVVDYKNLGAEELGSVYESLLELHPDLNAEAGSFELKVAAGSERKKTGSYYTPTSLISCLLDSALDPVLLEAATQPEPAAAILKLKVVDPACGSGHFLIAAAHRIAKRLAAVRTGEEEPPPEAQRKAIRDVIGHCIYGVDVNPMAVELCKVSLWMEALEPGKPLSFLEHRIQCGNSLLGATPALLAQGIPDEAFMPIEGDDKEICKEFKRINKDERNKQMRLFAATTEPWHQLGNFAASLMNLDTIGDDSIEAIREKERMYEEAMRSGAYLDGCFWADTWCAAFVWTKTREFRYPITEEVFRRIEHNPHACEPWMRDEIRRLAKQYQFLHWHVAFPDVFHVEPSGQTASNQQTGWSDGFDLVLGNPPWERITIRDNEWFAERLPAVANAGNAAVREMAIAGLKESDPELYRLFESEKRRASAEKALTRNSGLYPLCGHGDVNLFALFAERAQSLLCRTGSSGLILPTGIATTKTTAPFFEYLATTRKIVSIFDFDNRGGAFPAVQGNVRFCLLTASACGDQETFAAASFLLSTQDLERAGKLYNLTLDDLRAINPNTVGCPMFASSRDAELIKFMFRTVPILTHTGDTQSPWRVEIRRMFHMGDDAHLFWTRERLIDAGFKLVGNTFRGDSKLFLPLYESKLALQFNHRAATFEGIPPERRFGTHPGTIEIRPDELYDPTFCSIPRYWMAGGDAEAKLGPRQGLLSFRNAISATADSRSLVATVLPRYPAGASLTFVYADGGSKDELFLAGCLNSFVVDYVLRQKASGGNASLFILEQLPVAVVREPGKLSWLMSRLIELTYTAWDLQGFAACCELVGPPFKWDEERRFLLRCELDAAFFHLYLPTESNGGWRQAENETVESVARLKENFSTPRDAAAYILDAFPIVKRNDEEAWGEYRTKRVILEIFDAMTEAEFTGIPYRTRLDPPPADGRCCHSRKRVGILAFGSLIPDPGPEVEPRIVMRIKTLTPFPVEYARISGKTRGGAPTLVPHECGSPVEAEILVLEDKVSESEARDMLWRRERRRTGSGETYREGTPDSSVLVRAIDNSPWVSTVFYTDFCADGKLGHPTPADLATRAIQSVREADEGKDGISYLMQAIECGIETPLTTAYRAEILAQTEATSLEEAIKKAKGQ